MARKITHVIFDVDGTLLDTESLYSVAAKELVKPYGVEFTWELKQQLMGRRPIEACRIMIDALGLPVTPERLLELRTEAEDHLWPTCAAMPGAERLVRHLHSLGVPLALATGSDAHTLSLKQANHPWMSLVSAVVPGDDKSVKRGKPAPDMFLEAARRLGLPEGAEGSVLVFEDAPAGVQAAVAAGMHVVAVPDPQSPALKSGAFDRADQVLASLADFDPAHWGLAPFPASQ
eukprot:m51a1_g6682 hypothetical protein (232) ;mRNA; r:231655-232350